MPAVAMKPPSMTATTTMSWRYPPLGRYQSTPRQPCQHMATTAVVIGSGMGGLATAQILSKHFDKVLVIERDSAPHTIQGKTAAEVASMKAPARPGVSQYNHLHGMLAKGFELYDEIFDGRFGPALFAAGGRVANNHQSMLLFHPATGLLPWQRNTNPATPPVNLCLATRHLIETTARRLLEDNPRVEIMYEVAVSGLLFVGQEESAGDGSHGSNGSSGSNGSDAVRVGPASSSDSDAVSAAGAGAPGSKTVTGVVLTNGRRLCAQLVVDCSGRGSALPGWLAAAGYSRPHTTRAGCNCGYASWLCRLDPQVEATLLAAGVRGINVLPCAPERTMALLLQVEDGAWLAALGGNEGLHPSRSDEQLLEFAQKELWHPLAGRVLSGSTFLSPASRYYGITSTWRHYEDISLPDGLLVLGDGICAFNPAYGQGMTVAALEAATLSKLLQKRAVKHSIPSPGANGTASAGSNGSSGSNGSNGSSDGCPVWLQGLNKQFQAAILPTVQSAWGLVVGGDMRYPSAVSSEPGGASLADRLAAEYVQLVFAASADDKVHEAFVKVVHMLESPLTLMHPRVLARVLLANAGTLMRRVLQAGAPHWLLGLLCYQAGTTGKVAAPAASSSRQCKESPALMQLLGVVEAR